MYTQSIDYYKKIDSFISHSFKNKEEIVYQLKNNTIVLPQSIDIHLIRHAETQENAKGLITGSLDAELTCHGEMQARNLGKLLDKNYDIAICSELKRTKKTLELALNDQNIDTKLKFSDPRLNERSLGILEGRKRRSIEAYANGDLNYAPWGGESYNEVALRILSFLLDLSQLIVETNSQKILICSHTGIMRIIVGIIHEYSNPVDVLKLSFLNAEVFKLQWKELKIPDFLQGSL